MNTDRPVINDYDIETLYIRIERQGMTDEGYWAAVNGTEFDKGICGK